MENFDEKIKNFQKIFIIGFSTMITILLGCAVFVINIYSNSIENRESIKSLESRVDKLERDPINTLKFEIILTKLELLDAKEQNNSQLIYEKKEKIKELTNKLMLSSRNSNHTYRGSK